MNKKEFFINILVALTVWFIQFVCLITGLGGLLTGTIWALILGLVGWFGVLLVVWFIGKKYPEWFMLWYYCK